MTTTLSWKRRPRAPWGRRPGRPGISGRRAGTSYPIARASDPRRLGLSCAACSDLPAGTDGGLDEPEGWPARGGLPPARRRRRRVRRSGVGGGHGCRAAQGPPPRRRRARLRRLGGPEPHSRSTASTSHRSARSGLVALTTRSTAAHRCAGTCGAARRPRRGGLQRSRRCRTSRTAPPRSGCRSVRRALTSRPAHVLEGVLLDLSPVVLDAPRTELAAAKLSPTPGGRGGCGGTPPTNLS